MAYVTQSPDTTEAAERVQFEMLRRFGPGRRIEMMRRLSRTQLKLAWSGLKRGNPTLTERELQVKAVSLWYGEEHAQRLEKALKETGRWT